MKEQFIEDEVHLNKQKRREIKRNYLSSISTKYNPDILVGSTFIRGTEYFAKDASKAEDENNSFGSNKELEVIEENSKVAAEEESDEDFAAMMKQKASRYWAEENPTIKCRNCK